MIITSKITNKRENDFYRHLALLSFPRLPARSVISQDGYDLSLVTNPDWILQMWSPGFTAPLRWPDHYPQSCCLAKILPFFLLLCSQCDPLALSYPGSPKVLDRGKHSPVTTKRSQLRSCPWMSALSVSLQDLLPSPHGFVSAQLMGSSATGER